jgi:hypothetical protein
MVNARKSEQLCIKWKRGSVTKDDEVYKPGRVLEYAGKWTFILSPEDMDELAFLFQEVGV